MSRSSLRILWLPVLRLCLALVVVGLGSGAAQHVAAQDVEQASVADGGGSFSAELRFRLFTTAYRWSSYSSDVVDLPDAGRRSLYLVPSLGARFYTKHDHGVLVDVDYRLDIDVDSNAGFLCIFDCPPTLWTEFVVAHVGYAYRHVIPSRRPSRITWTVSPHASIAAGSSYSQGGGSSERVFSLARRRGAVRGRRRPSHQALFHGLVAAVRDFEAHWKGRFNCRTSFPGMSFPCSPLARSSAARCRLRGIGSRAGAVAEALLGRESPGIAGDWCSGNRDCILM